MRKKEEDLIFYKNDNPFESKGLIESVGNAYQNLVPVQNTIGKLATNLEKLENLINFTDITLSFLFYFCFFMLCCFARFWIWLLELEVTLFLISSSKFWKRHTA